MRRTPMGRRWETCARMLGVAVLLGSSGIAAAAAPGRAFILRIDEHRAIIDSGRDRGLRPRMKVQVFKRYVLRHPVTGVRIEDVLPLGEGRVHQVSNKIASVDLGRITKARVGDVITMGEAAPGPERGAVAATCRSCRLDPVARAVHEAWLRASMGDAASRRAVWSRYLRAHPRSPYRQQAAREVAFLNALLDPRPTADDDFLVFADQSLERVDEGAPLEPALLLPRWASRNLRAVALHYRPRGGHLYARVVMQPDGDGYYRGRIPAAAVKPPGVAYFAEAVDPTGKVTPIFGSARRPVTVEVRRRLVAPDERSGRSRLRLTYDYVDFYLPGASRDFYWKLDGSFTYRVDFGALSHFTLGFGFFEGFGGDVVVVERQDDASARLDALAFGFVYLQPEVELHPYFAILPRLTLGQLDRQQRAGADTGRRTNQIAGGHAFLRIGRRSGTHLVVGGGFTQHAGMETQIALNLRLWERTPLSFSAVVSNVPVNRDLGLILRAGIAHRFTDWLEVGGHLGFAARNINHTGVSAGTSVSFIW